MIEAIVVFLLRDLHERYVILLSIPLVVLNNVLQDLEPFQVALPQMMAVLRHGRDQVDDILLKPTPVRT